MSDEWGTPQKLFDKLDAEFSFTLDVCAGSANAKVATYYSKEEDGLKQPWFGTVWCNPPYGRTIDLWMSKAYHAALVGTTVVCLIPARTNAPWWHDYVMRADEIRFIRKKVSFDGDVKGLPFFGSVLAIFRPGQSRGLISSYTRD